MDRASIGRGHRVVDPKTGGRVLARDVDGQGMAAGIRLRRYLIPIVIAFATGAMFGGEVRCPLVIRTPYGGGVGGPIVKNKTFFFGNYEGMREAVEQGADLIVRLNPFSIVLCDPLEQPVVLRKALKRQPLETIRTLPVVIQPSGGQPGVQGWMHAYRLSTEQAGRARHKCRQRHKKGAPTAESLWLAGWVLVFTTLAPAVPQPRRSCGYTAVVGKLKSR